MFNQNGAFLEDSNRLLPQLKTYTPPFKGEDSEDIAVADFDKDGDLDLFFVSEDTENHELLLNNGLGQFDFAPNLIPKIGQANGVLVYDFNRDNYPDILIGIRAGMSYILTTMDALSKIKPLNFGQIIRTVLRI